MRSIVKVSTLFLAKAGLLWVCALFVAALPGCSTKERRADDVEYDSLSAVVNKNLNSHADSALLLSDRLYRLAKATGDKDKIYEAAKLRGKAFQTAQLNDSALIWFQQMRALAFATRDTTRMLETCNILGSLYGELGSNDSVKYWFGMGAAMARDAGDSIYQAGFAANMGLYFSQSGQADSAMACYSEALHYYERKGDSANIAQLCRNIGNVFLGEGLYQKANEDYQRAVTINLTMGNLLEAATDYSNLAVSHMMMGSDSTQTYFMEAMRIYTQYGTVNNLLPVKFNYANYLKDQGRYAQAEQAYREVLTLSRTHKILPGEMYSLNQLGRMEALRRDATAANAYFEEAIDLALKNRQIADLVQFYHEAFEANLEIQNVPVALNYFKKWERLNDSLKTTKQRETILKYQSLYESQVLQLKVHDLNNELKIKKSQNVITLLVAILLILAMTTLVILYRFRNKQARQRQELAEQRQLRAEQENQLRQVELEKVTLEKAVQEEKFTQMNLQMQLREQDLVYQTLLRTDLSNLNRSIQERLLPFQLQFKRKKDQQDFLQALQEIARDAAHDPLEDFERMFSQMHGSFFEKLLQMCPDFTKSELQVASMIRLNLSTKEIARLMNLSPATIDTTRHHIRRKLTLDQKESLTATLIAI